MKVIIYDDANRRPWYVWSCWAVGAWLYRLIRRVDAVYPAQSWAGALQWLLSLGKPLAEVQFWGHGSWGRVLIGSDALNSWTVSTSHVSALRDLRERLAPGAIWWFRACQVFGAVPGQRFAVEWCRALDCTVASHTFIIHVWHGGLCVLHPGDEPGWPVAEGYAAGSRDLPRDAIWARPWSPRTILALRTRIPKRYLRRPDE